MQVKPFVFTILIAFGLAILAHSWQISWPGSRIVTEQSSMSIMHASPVLESDGVLVRDTAGITFESLKPAIQYDSSTVSIRIQDLILRTRIQKRLFEVEEVKGLDILVATNSGHVVVEGVVHSDKNRQLVSEAVRKVLGVKSLDNRLRVQGS